MVVDVFVITLVFTALVSGFITALKTVNSGKVRLAAASIANQQMEKLRNLPYDSLATEHGTILPQGSILDTETINQSGSNFTLQTTIITVDDPFDGCAIPSAGQYQCTDGALSATQDSVPVDYKRISVAVSEAGSSVTLSKITSNAAAKAAETPTNTGILLVIVNDAEGNPVDSATVTITNLDTDTSVVATTNAQGYVFVANVTPDNQNGYHIVATKTGYSTDFTTPRTSQNPNQFQPDVDVNAQQITTQTLVIDRLATMAVTVKSETGAPAAGVAITATSEKYVQVNPLVAKNTYNQTTDAAGLATFTNIEWDSYALSVPSGYYVTATSPYQNVAITPGQTTPVTLSITTNSSWPAISSITPESGVSGTTVNVVVNGSNFDSGATVSLQLAGQTAINPVSTNVAANGKSITLTFNLAGAAAGSWDVVVSSASQLVTELEGFTIS